MPVLGDLPKRVEEHRSLGEFSLESEVHRRVAASRGRRRGVLIIGECIFAVLSLSPFLLCVAADRIVLGCAPARCRGRAVRRGGPRSLPGLTSEEGEWNER